MSVITGHKGEELSALILRAGIDNATQMSAVRYDGKWTVHYVVPS